MLRFTPQFTPRAPARDARQGHSAPRLGLTYVYGCVHTVHHHDRRWVPTPKMRWRMVRDVLAHAVWLRGQQTCPPLFRRAPIGASVRTGHTGRAVHFVFLHKAMGVASQPGQAGPTFALGAFVSTAKASRRVAVRKTNVHATPHSHGVQ